MEIFIITVGSLGDVQPYVALGKGLVASGHRVTICTCELFSPLIREHGLHYAYMTNDFIKLVDSAAGREAVEQGDTAFGLMKSMVRLFGTAKKITRKMCSDAWIGARAVQPDFVIYHPKAIAGPHIAEKLAIPLCMAVPMPVIVPTTEFVAMGMPTVALGKWYNRFSYALLHKGYAMYNSVVNEFRRNELGLAELPRGIGPLQLADRSEIPVLHCYSEHVSPRPADWPESAHVTGYWFLQHNDDWQPPAGLRSFLASGEKPVYIGFGSMAGRNPKRLTQCVLEALQQTGLRGILASGWGGLNTENMPENLYAIKNVPHSWLFPRVSAVVHHGGAGTTAAGLYAGCPTVICPFAVDQPFWGRRVHAIGAGSMPLPQKKMTAERLSKALQKVTMDSEIRSAAQNISEKLHKEDGIARTIEIIERINRNW